MSSRKFKVLDSSGLGFGVDFTDMTLDYLTDSRIPGCVVLAQPKSDVNGEPCSGVVTFDLANVVEIEMQE